VAKRFSISFERRNWENVINDIEAAIRATEHSMPKDESAFFSDIATEFRHFKNAWRNHVMHGRAEYRFDTARRILTSVRDFMAGLATRLAEE
jgi:hypothetical protein